MLPAISLTDKKTPFGLALLTCATLLMEITFTRIFSVTMWYHFAFMAISVAMFGMAMGSVIVYLRPKWFPQEKIRPILAKLSLSFAASIVVTFWLHLHIPFIPALTFIGVASIILTFLLITIPFVFSGIAVSLVLTRFPKDVGKLYAFDLIGAAIGCILLWLFMRPLTGPGVVLAGAAIGGASAFVFAWEENKKKLFYISGFVTLTLVLMAVLQPHYRILEIRWVKNAWGGPMAQKVDMTPMIERWNSHASVTVFNTTQDTILGWGLSETFKPDYIPKQLYLLIDAAAGTVITQYDNKPNKVKHFKYDVTSLAHHIRPESDVLVIGVGGGRDILTSLMFNPKSVTGVEINADILDLVNSGQMGDFTGHLDLNPKVNFYNDEARSWVERSNKKFDIIQASLIDSWAATSAGAFVLTENSLYTREAWIEFINHLSDRGVLTMSRWWVRGQPGEMMRATSLAYSALRELGVKNPRNHVLIAATDFDQETDNPNGVGTIIVSKRPLSKNDVESFTNTCKQMKFRILLTPVETEFQGFAKILDPSTSKNFTENYKLNIKPSTDDNPFFFNMLRFRDIFNNTLEDNGVTGFNMRAITILGSLFGMVILMSLLGLLLPLWLHERGNKSEVSKLDTKAVWRHSIYFAAIGLGFILVEIGQIQRLTLFLGHPVYSLVIVLFSLLLATGIGSSLSSKWIGDDEKSGNRAFIAITVLFIISLLAVWVLPLITSMLYGSALTPRIVISIVLMFIMGIPMGAAFPTGLRLASVEVERATPWLWAINGALSVVGSVLAMILSIGYGITATCLVGALCYLLAVVVLKLNLKAAK